MFLPLMIKASPVLLCTRKILWDNCAEFYKVEQSEPNQSTAKSTEFAENVSLLEANAGFSVSLYAEAANFSSCASIARMTDWMESTSASPK